MNGAIRPARTEDAPRIWELVCELAEYERLSHLATGDASRLAAHLFGDPPKAEALVAEDESGVVGYALFFGSYSTFLATPGIWLEDLYVSPSHRGRGLGKALLQAVASLAIQRGCARLEWSVLEWNASAIEFYESLGAARLSEWQICRSTGNALTRLADQ